MVVRALRPQGDRPRVIDNSISTSSAASKQEITLVFTDVQGFTTIAESADPDMLMLQTSRYFSVLTEAFLAEGGTVDKFIGDAVMVFWNAPIRRRTMSRAPAGRLLRPEAAGERLNAEFEAEGLKPFFTRFGIHVGEAVVGNVGSTERMNYTALGNTVNLAARLEGLNKQFGTTILVSEDVYLRVRDLPVQSLRCGRCQGHDKGNPHLRTCREHQHEPGLVLRRHPHVGAARFGVLVVPAAHAAEDTIKVGILHSLSGTMAISESVLKDTVLMLIADQNKKGGLLGGNWSRSSSIPRRLGRLCRKGPRVAHRRKRSRSYSAAGPPLPQIRSARLRAIERPAVLPRAIRGRRKLAQHLLHRRRAEPAGHSGRSLSDEQGRWRVRRWVLLGTDYVYPRTTNRILSAYLAAEGVAQRISRRSTRRSAFRLARDRSRIKAFGSEGKKTAVISTVNGDANTHFYRELGPNR
jgi:class 3 adenylate cyclase